MSKIITGSICVDDIDKSAITTGNNGKRYININIVERKKTGKYGETHFIAQYVKGADSYKNPIIGNAKPLAWQAPTDPNDPFA